MLTCNKNFVDLTVWILRSWTCIKLNIMLHRSLEKEREPADWAETKPPPSSHHQPDRAEPDRTGLNRTEQVGSVWNRRSWTELDVGLCSGGALAWRFGWCSEGLNCCMRSFRWSLCFNDLWLCSCTSWRRMRALSHCRLSLRSTTVHLLKCENMILFVWQMEEFDLSPPFLRQKVCLTLVNKLNPVWNAIILCMDDG